MSVTTQGKFPLFYADVGSRLKWLREQQGVTLDKLGDGHPTTAQSWEKGKNPHRTKWKGIAERLGLSELLIFHGRPESPADYAFIVKHRQLIQGADEYLSPGATAAQHAFAADEEDEFGPHQRRHLKSGGQPAAAVQEEPASYPAVATRIPQRQEPSTRDDCERLVREIFDRAEASGNPNAFPVIYDRLQEEFRKWLPAPPKDD